jgi:hypothetical protein
MVCPTRGFGGCLYSPEEVLRHHTRSGVRLAAGPAQSTLWGGRSAYHYGASGPSLVGMCASSCRFRKTIICIKRSPDEDVMPLLPTPLYNWYLLILDSKYGNWYICFDHLVELFAMLHFNSSFGMLLCSPFVGVGLEYDWDTSWSPMTWQFLLFSRLVPANHNFTKTYGNH